MKSRDLQHKLFIYIDYDNLFNFVELDEVGLLHTINSFLLYRDKVKIPIRINFIEKPYVPGRGLVPGNIRVYYGACFINVYFSRLPKELNLISWKQRRNFLFHTILHELCHYLEFGKKYVEKVKKEEFIKPQDFWVEDRREKYKDFKYMRGLKRWNAIWESPEEVLCRKYSVKKLDMFLKLYEKETERRNYKWLDLDTYNPKVLRNKKFKDIKKNLKEVKTIPFLKFIRFR